MGFFASLPLAAGVVGDILRRGVLGPDHPPHRPHQVRPPERGHCRLPAGGGLHSARGAASPTVTSAPRCSACAVFGLELVVGNAWAVTLDIGGSFAGSCSAVMNTFGNIGGAIIATRDRFHRQGLWLERGLLCRRGPGGAGRACCSPRSMPAASWRRMPPARWSENPQSARKARLLRHLGRAFLRGSLFRRNWLWSRPHGTFQDARGRRRPPQHDQCRYRHDHPQTVSEDHPSHRPGQGAVRRDALQHRRQREAGLRAQQAGLSQGQDPGGGREFRLRLVAASMRPGRCWISASAASSRPASPTSSMATASRTASCRSSCRRQRSTS